MDFCSRWNASARIPCLQAFWATAALPSSVLGPVDNWALRRLASICFSEAMVFFSASNVADEIVKRGGRGGEIWRKWRGIREKEIFKSLVTEKDRISFAAHIARSKSECRMPQN